VRRVAHNQRDELVFGRLVSRGRRRRHKAAAWVARSHRRPTPSGHANLPGHGTLSATAWLYSIGATGAGVLSATAIMKIGPAGPFACVWFDPKSDQSRWSFHQSRISAAAAAPPDAVAPIVVDRTVKARRRIDDSAALDRMVASLRREQREGMRRRLRAQQKAEAGEADTDPDSTPVSI
jgi:hypothetical protein